MSRRGAIGPSPTAIGVRYGYRRGHVLLRREGWMITIKKTRRIYNELALQLRNKNPKRRVQGWGAAHRPKGISLWTREDRGRVKALSRSCRSFRKA